MGKALLARVDASMMQSVNSELHRQLHARVAAQLRAHLSQLGALCPLPVLGIPGWTSRQDESFYQNADYFRTRRHNQPNATRVSPILDLG